MKMILNTCSSVKQLPLARGVCGFGKYRPDQARVPAGNLGGGQWVNEEREARKKPPSHSNSLRLTSSKKIEKRAKAIYGETSGLFPKLKSPQSSPYSPSNWDSNSMELLHEARVYVGIVSERNRNVNFAKPANPNNPLQVRAWAYAVDAAIAGGDSGLLDSSITHFFLRQDGIGPQVPPWGNQLHLYLSVGPFYNVGGGDLPKGSRAYIDFYGK